MTPELPDQTHVHTQADLEVLWRRLLGDLGFGRSTLWMLLLKDDGLVLPVVVPVDDIPERPTSGIEGLTEMLHHVVPPGGSVAFLLSRPGPDAPLSPAEKAWTRALAVVSSQVGATVWPVHRANDDALRVCSPDDLAA